MVHRQSEIKQLLRKVTRARDKSEIWSDDYSELFRPSKQNLVKRYSVPRFEKPYRIRSGGWT